MPKIIGEETKQVSVRVDVEALARIDAIRDSMKKATKIRPQRADVLRMLIVSGLDAYESNEQRKKEKEKKG